MSRENVVAIILGHRGPNIMACVKKKKIKTQSTTRQQTIKKITKSSRSVLYLSKFKRNWPLLDLREDCANYLFLV